MTKDEALDLALEIMHNQGDVGVAEWRAAEAAIKQVRSAPVQPVAWGVFEGGNLHDMFFTQKDAEDMAHLKGANAEVRPLCTPPADGYDKVLQAIKEARPAVVALKDKPVSWWLDRFEEFVKQLKEKHT